MLSLQHVHKRFAHDEVLKDFSLDVRDGEFFTLLGPSGCGKTTVLRLVAGLEQADRGSIAIDGECIDRLPAEKRPVNTVFQGYALFPHMTVAKNVGFGLRMAGVGRAEIDKRVGEALDLVRLPGFGKRSPSRLSGGQRQRVAIARALVMRPRVLLLDESLSALDYRLRLQMRMELKQIQRTTGITFVYVTHDQEEALSMSDRLLVMNQGRVQQIGTPREIYERPANLFVAGFIGEINVFEARVVAQAGASNYRVDIGGVEKTVRCDTRLDAGDEVRVLLRPEDLRVEDAGASPQEKSGFFGRVVDRSYTGQTLESLIETEDGRQLRASEYCDADDPEFDSGSGQRVRIDWKPGWEHVIRAEKN